MVMKYTNYQLRAIYFMCASSHETCTFKSVVHASFIGAPAGFFFYLMKTFCFHFLVGFLYLQDYQTSLCVE